MELKCPKCGAGYEQKNSECPECGIIFEKYLRAVERKRGHDGEDPEINGIEAVKEILFHVRPESDYTFFCLKLIFFIFFVYQGIRFMASSLSDDYIMNSFWHLVNLPFHEAGHVIFRLFGEFMTSLGGSLGQLLIPVICMMAFLFKTRDTFGASFCLWWLGQNFIDLAPYIDDARRLTMPLLGGNTGMDSPYGFHDWEFILTETGLINFDHIIASVFLNTGKFLIFLYFLWSGFLLFKEFRMIRL